MTITLDPELEARLREEAEEEGLALPVYIERLLAEREQERAELEALALEGLNSGPAVEVGPEFWEDIHREIDERHGRSE